MEGCARKEKTSGRRVNLIFFVEVEILETKFQLKFFYLILDWGDYGAQILTVKPLCVAVWSDPYNDEYLLLWVFTSQWGSILHPWFHRSFGWRAIVDLLGRRTARGRNRYLPSSTCFGSSFVRQHHGNHRQSNTEQDILVRHRFNFGVHCHLSNRRNRMAVVRYGGKCVGRSQ